MWMDKEMLKQLEKVRADTGKGSVADVVREAVSVYSSLMAAKDRGIKFWFESKSGEKCQIWLLPGAAPFDET